MALLSFGRIRTVHALLFGRNPSNEAQNVIVGPAGQLHSADFLLEVNKGNVSGHSLIHKFGNNKSFSTTIQDVWAQTGTLTHLQAAETMNVISSDTVNDISTGSNARVITLEGLDANFNVVTEDVTLLATAVTTTQSFIRVYRMYVKAVGTYGVANVGAITATATTAATVQNNIAIGDGQSGTTHYTIPTGFTGYLIRVSASVDASKTANFHWNMRENADDVTVPFSPKRILHHWEGIITTDLRLLANHVFAAKTDIWVSGDMTSVTGEVDFDYDLLLVADGY